MREARVGILRAKALLVFLLVATATMLEGVIIPIGGVILEPIPVAQASLRENPVCYGRATVAPSGIVTSLEVSFEETHLLLALLVSLLVMCCFCRWRDKVVGADGWFEGGYRAHVVVTNVYWKSGVVAWVSALSACSGSRRMALLGNCQCGVGLCRRTALATTTSWDD